MMRGIREGIASSGLRWRIAAWAAIVIVSCLAVAFVAVYRGTGTQLRGQTDRRLKVDIGELSRVLASARVHSTANVAIEANRYVRSRPFGASSTLLFAAVPGSPIITNRPELFHLNGADDGETRAEQARENRLSGQLLTARSGYSTLPVSDLGDLRLLKRSVRAGGGSAQPLSVTIGAGEPLAPVSNAQHGVAKAFVLAGALALLGALLGGYLIGSRTSRPLRRMAVVAERVDAGDLHPRIHPRGATAAEVRVLAIAFNHMLDRLTAAFASQQEFLADASHELRTPVTVIRGQLEVLSENPNPRLQEIRRVESLLQAEVARIDRLIEDLLLLAELEQTDFLQMEAVKLEPFVRELWNSTTLIAQRRFILGPIPSGMIEADPDRLAQALRNLLVNAIKHTAERSGTVRLTVEPLGGDRLRFAVEDDGPGIPPTERERVFDRFHRTDAARDRVSGGSGLGLAIVKAIASAHGGVVGVEGSSLGGARLSMDLPSFRPFHAATRRPRHAAPQPDGSHADPVSEKAPTG